MLLLILFRMRRGCEVGKPTNEEYKEIKEEWLCGRGNAELLVERKVLPDHRHGLLSHNPSGRPRLHAHVMMTNMPVSRALSGFDNLAFQLRRLTFKVRLSGKTWNSQLQTVRRRWYLQVEGKKKAHDRLNLSSYNDQNNFFRAGYFCQSAAIP